MLPRIRFHPVMVVIALACTQNANNTTSGWCSCKKSSNTMAQSATLRDAVLTSIELDCEDDSCVSEELDLVEPAVAAVEASIAAGRIRFDADAARACHARCTSTDATDDCARMLVGLVGDGGTCALDLDCAAGRACDDATLRCSGQLQDAAPGLGRCGLVGPAIGLSLADQRRATARAGTSE